MDFQLFSADPRFCELLAEFGLEHPSYEIDPVAELARLDAYAPLCEQASRYTAGAVKFMTASPAPGPVTVIGYCSAAALSLRLAVALAQTRPVRALLIRPVWPDSAMIHDEFYRLRQNLGAGPGAVPGLDGGGAAALRAMTDQLRADVRAMAVRHDIDESDDSLTDLLAQYRAWLGFLLSSRDSLSRPWEHPVPLHVLTDDRDEVDVPWRDLASYAVTSHPVTGSRHERDEELARLALRVLRGGR